MQEAPLEAEIVDQYLKLLLSIQKPIGITRNRKIIWGYSCSDNLQKRNKPITFEGSTDVCNSEKEF